MKCGGGGEHAAPSHIKVSEKVKTKENRSEQTKRKRKKKGEKKEHVVE